MDHKIKGMFKVNCKYSLSLDLIQNSLKSHGSSDSNIKYDPSSLDRRLVVVVGVRDLPVPLRVQVCMIMWIQLRDIANHLASCNVLDNFNSSLTFLLC